MRQTWFLPYGSKGANSWGRGSQQRVDVLVLFLYPISFCYQVWIEWNTYDVPGPVLSIRYRMSNRNDILCLHRELILRTLNMHSKLLICKP